MDINPIHVQVVGLLEQVDSIEARFKAVNLNGFNKYKQVNGFRKLDNYQSSAWAAGASYLGSSFDAFRSLKLSHLNQSTSPATLMNVSIASMGLVRQMLEPLLFSKWLITAKSADELRIRGFAIVWLNMTERARHAQAIQEIALPVVRKNVNKELKVGWNLGLIDITKSTPSITLPAVTSLLKNERIPTNQVANLQKYFGSKVDEPEWIYRWLSGIAHGHIWANTTAKQTNAKGISTQTVHVDWNRFGVALMYTYWLFDEVLKLYENPLKCTK